MEDELQKSIRIVKVVAMAKARAFLMLRHIYHDRYMSIPPFRYDPVSHDARIKLFVTEKNNACMGSIASSLNLL